MGSGSRSQVDADRARIATQRAIVATLERHEDALEAMRRLVQDFDFECLCDEEEPCSLCVAKRILNEHDEATKEKQ